ncbi:uncharacterized protein J3D65DRAFT_225205 [Phyllosticta citribraziliensis]|uniref:Uncharacterized protein n=1 Tax=Phyllosticta citribraziliensis TaxID=989973 RepID=A0ABR1M6P6_9PEZI
MANLKTLLLLCAWIAAGIAIPLYDDINLGEHAHSPRALNRIGLGGAFHEINVESSTEQRSRALSNKETASGGAPWSVLVSRILATSSNTSSCDGAAYPNECRTAAQAGPPIFASWAKYDISSMATRAAVVSLMLYESGDFKYNWGHFVSGQTIHTPGKGTRNMQSATYNEEYATFLFGADKVAQAKSSGGADGVLSLVSGDEASFGSAAWFLTTQCTKAVQQGVASGTQAGFEEYITGCIGGTMDDSRIEYWTKAKAAWGVE